MKVVMMTPADMEEAYDRTITVQQDMKAKGKKEIKFNPESKQFRLNFQGVVGQMAFAYMFPKLTDLTAIDTHIDFENPVTKKTVDVKTVCNQKTPILMTHLGKASKPCDFYVLMHIREKLDGYRAVSVEYLGWELGEKFLRGVNKKNHGHGDCFSINQGDLNKNFDFYSGLEET